MKNLSKRVDKLEMTNKYSYEQLFKLHQPILMKLLKQVTYESCDGKKDPSLELTKQEKKISELYEQRVRADPVLYDNSIYAFCDRALEN